MNSWRRHTTQDGSQFWGHYGPEGGIIEVLPCDQDGWIEPWRGLPTDDTWCIVSMSNFVDADKWLQADGELVMKDGWLKHQGDLVRAWQPAPGVFHK
jgi:hypothetical protein